MLTFEHLVSFVFIKTLQATKASKQTGFCLNFCQLIFPRLLSKMGVVEFAPPLQETKEIIISCLQEIVKSTQKFPRIEKELFPGIFEIKHYCTNAFSKRINLFKIRIGSLLLEN